MIIQLLRGIALGAGAILPGISSGVLCVVFGIYEKLLDAILGFFHDVKKNVAFLFPLLVGILFGVVLFGNLLNYIFSHFHSLACFCFIGLILGSVPGILKEAKIKNANPICFLALLLSFSFSLFLISLEYTNSFYFTTGNSVATSTTFLSFVIAGFAMSAGVVIPGVSSTIILMLLGKYEIYLSSVASLNLTVLFPMGIGLVLGGFFLLFLIRFLLVHFRNITYFAIIGFVLGSIPVLFPNTISSCFELLTGISLVIGCSFLAIVSSSSKKQTKNGSKYFN